MAAVDSSAPINVPSEMIVYMNHCISEYHGTRAMLEAEGVIPADFEWPNGYLGKTWSDDKNDYLLFRRRPDGAKGPRKLFIDVDWWHFRWTPLNADDYFTRRLKQKEKDLADCVHSMSPKGRAEFDELWYAHRELCKDKKFQEFMALIPGITKLKRARKANSAR